MKRSSKVVRKGIPDLRTRAEAIMPPRGRKAPPPSPAEARRLLEELHVHQIELELQNEELRRAQGELAEARDRFSDLYDFAPVGYVTLDPQGAVREANLTAARMFGIDRKTLVGRQFSRFLSRESQDAFYLHCRIVFDSQSPHACELVVRRANGTTFHARLESAPFTPPTAANGRSCHTAIVDVTPLHEAMAALHSLAAELEQRVAERTQEVRHLGTLVQAADDAIFTWTPEGSIQFWNAGAQKLYGYTAEEALGRPVDILLPADCRAEWHRQRQRALAGEPLVPYETRRLRKDGQIIFVSLAHSIIRDAQGRVVALACIGRDISVQKEAEAHRQRYEEQLRSLTHQVLSAEERERRKLANDLHDGLSQVLSAISLKLDNLVRSVAPGEASDRLREFQALIAHAKQESRDLTYGLFPPILRQSGLMPALRWLANNTKQRYKLDVTINENGRLAGISPELESLAFRCTQELLANAGKHAHARRARVSAALHNGTLDLIVADDGRGFPPPRPPAVTPHPNESPSPAATPPGFGLFSIHERLEFLGGSMKIASTPGKGSTVELKIPVHPHASTPEALPDRQVATQFQ